MKEETIVGGRYELLERIGAGGEAEVFRARDLQQEREVAVRISAQGQAGIDGLTRPEFHAGWVELLDAGGDAECGGYQVFELLRGETLCQKVERAPLDLPAWMALVRQSLESVGALHAAGWVHGDLNAENLLQIDAPPSRWKLLELPFLSATPAERSVLFGGIHTLSPEQLQGQAPTAPSDLFALGCLYYYAAAGEYPHPGANRQEVVISMLRFPPVPLREKVRDWPAALSDWTMGLLERKPERRCVSTEKARQLLERIA